MDQSNDFWRKGMQRGWCFGESPLSSQLNRGDGKRKEAIEGLWWGVGGGGEKGKEKTRGGRNPDLNL